METVNVRLTKKLIQLVEREVKRGKYSSKSEFIREAIRRMFEERVRPEILAELTAARKEMEEGEFIHHEEVVKKLKHAPRS
ncbi:MAG: ribbon-helix-helix domain-containing protein [Candidatus Thermoplasmatota archaeon]|nr:ribbon-helix-helix domain-containing protein [Candidatus Thermoplasmatota archaeon]